MCAVSSVICLGCTTNFMCKMYAVGGSNPSLLHCTVQVRLQPRVGYMHKQPDITPSMRSVLVDWLVEVSDEFSLQPSTLYLAVSLVDRFLSVMSVLRGKLQLVGTTAVYMAAKLEEIYPPELSDFAYITDNTYTHQQVRWGYSVDRDLYLYAF